MGTNETISDDYHDYVFRDGRLVGEFDTMYRVSKEIPWHQDRQDEWPDIRIANEMIRDLGPFDRIHDYGCGLGYYLDILRRQVGAQSCEASGSDISPTACTKASALFPHARFFVDDLTRVSQGRTGRPAPSGRGLASIRGTLWYVFPHLEEVVRNLAERLGSADVLLVSQNFPPLDSNFIGKDVIPDPASLLRRFSAHLRCRRWLWYEDREAGKNDNWFIGLFAAK